MDTCLPSTPDLTHLNIPTPDGLVKWEHDTFLDRNRTLRVLTPPSTLRPRHEDGVHLRDYNAVSTVHIP